MEMLNVNDPSLFWDQALPKSLPGEPYWALYLEILHMAWRLYNKAWFRYKIKAWSQNPDAKPCPRNKEIL